MSEQEAKQVVLEWLKINYQYGDAEHGLINELFLMISNVPMTAQENVALNMLSEKAEFELIAEFASWGLEEVGRMKQVGFYFSRAPYGARSGCPECGWMNTTSNPMATFESIKINRPVYVQCDHCETLYNIGGTGEEESK